MNELTKSGQPGIVHLSEAANVLRDKVFPLRD
jgi:hypothetical protein